MRTSSVSKSDSPAIDRGTRTLAPIKDIVNAARPQGAKYDIGAYETSYTSATPIANDVTDIDAIRQTMIFTPENGAARYGTPIIDGAVDDIWNTAPVLNANKYIDNATAPVTSGATAKVRVLWDVDNLYVLSEVTDPVLRKTNVNPWEQDSVEVFLDENNGKTTSHQPDDRQYRINYDNAKTVGSQGNISEFTSATSLISGGYIVEVKIPFKTIKGSIGKVIGFDSQVNDDNGVGARTSTAIWSDTKGVGYSNTSRWGNVTLLEQVDVESPVTAVTVTPIEPNGQNGWYLQPVTVTLTAVDSSTGVDKTEYSLDGGISWLAYSTPLSFGADGMYTILYRSKDKAGNIETAHSASLHLDSTGPVISVSGIVYGTISANEVLVPNISMNDILSGVDASKSSAQLDEATYNFGESIPLYTLPLGNHTLVVSSTDLAGNSSSAALNFTTYATVTSMQSLVTLFETKNWIDNKGIANSMRKKLSHGQIDPFIQEVLAQAGKHISSKAAEYLLQQARYVKEDAVTQ